MRIRDYISSLDYSVILLAIFLCVAGAILIYSATTVDVTAVKDPYFFLKKQLLYILMGVVIMFLMTTFDFNKLRNFVIPLYALNTILLTAVMFLGKTTSGAQRWIDLGIFNLQPSEFAKIFLIIFMAVVLSTKKGETVGIKKVGLCLLGLTIPLLLTFEQPDLGTSLVLVAIFLGMLFCSGVEMRIFLVFLLVGILIVMVAVKLPLLKPYQINRLTVFFNPEQDPQGAGYNLIQSKIAIGSGLVAGKGLFSGSQTVLGFVPEHHTDFIFAVLGEKMGFIGGSIILLVYLLLILRAVRIATASRNTLGMLIAVGIVSMLTFQIFVNVGMTIGIMPITGIPLPFLSFGGCSLLTNMMAMGLLLNVAIRKFTIGDMR